MIVRIDGDSIVYIAETDGDKELLKRPNLRGEILEGKHHFENVQLVGGLHPSNALVVDAEAMSDAFEKWLRTVCFQKPTSEAYDLARDAWQEAVRMEREACAQEADESVRVWSELGRDWGETARARKMEAMHIAVAIRARSEEKT